MKYKNIIRSILFLNILILPSLWEGMGMGCLFAQQTTWQTALDTNIYGRNVVEQPNSSNSMRLYSIAATKDTGVIIVAEIGSSSSSVGLDLIKLNKNGALQWSTKLSAYPVNRPPTKIMQADDGGYVMVGGNLDAHITKTDANGNVQWAKKIGNYVLETGSDVRIEYTDFQDIEKTNDGNYILIGSTANFGTKGVATITTPDVYLVKTTTAGAILWTKTYGNESVSEKGTSIKPTADGGYIISGSGLTPLTFQSNYFAFLLKVDALGSLQWCKTYETEGFNSTIPFYSRTTGSFNDVIPTNDGGYIATGQQLGGDFYIDHGMWLVKTDHQGKVQWTKDYLDIEPDYSNLATKSSKTITALNVYQIAQDGYIVASRSALIKVDVSGNLKWFRTYGAGISYGGVDFTQNGYLSTVTQDSGFALTNYFGFDKGGFPDYPDYYDGLGVQIRKVDSTGMDGTCQNNYIGFYTIPTVIEAPLSVITNTGLIEAPLTITTTSTSISLLPGCMTAPIRANFYPNHTCFGDSTHFSNYSSGALFSWNFGDPSSGASNTSTAIYPNHLFSAIGNYTVTLTATDASGSPSDDASIVVQIFPKKFITLSGNVTICKGDSALLSASGWDTTKGYFGTWWNLGGVVNNATNPTYVFPEVTSHYKAIAYNTGSCSDTDSLLVSVIAPNAKPVIKGNTTICFGVSTSLSASGANNYLWSTGETTSSITLSNINASNTFTVSSFNGGCYSTNTITVVLLPNVTVNVGENATIIKGSSAVLTMDANGTLVWSPMLGLDCNTCLSATANPTITTTYYITVKSVDGLCESSDSITVYVISCDGEVQIPNAFSPNGDDKNDVLLITANECLQSLTMHIYNRWGEKMVNHKWEIENGVQNILVWDGTYKGKKLDNGVFVYAVEVITKNGDTISKKGNISLIR